MNEEQQVVPEKKSWYWRNKEKHIALVKAWELRNKERVRRKRAEWRLANKDHIRDVGYRYRHGITLAAYNTLLDSQDGKCAICGKPPKKGGTLTAVLAIDHNHSTGAVRGLLCNLCNRYIGYIHESHEILDRAKAYLS